MRSHSPMRSHARTALGSMRSSLRSFAKYVPQDVVRLLMRERREAILGVDETEITVRTRPRPLTRARPVSSSDEAGGGGCAAQIFFSDVADFATIAESMVPEDLVELLR